MYTPFQGKCSPSETLGQFNQTCRTTFFRGEIIATHWIFNLLQVLRPIQHYFTHMETSQLQVKNFKF